MTCSYCSGAMVLVTGAPSDGTARWWQCTRCGHRERAD